MVVISLCIQKKEKARFVSLGDEIQGGKGLCLDHLVVLELLFYLKYRDLLHNFMKQTAILQVPPPDDQGLSSSGRESTLVPLLKSG